MSTTTPMATLKFGLAAHDARHCKCSICSSKRLMDWFSDRLDRELIRSRPGRARDRRLKRQHELQYERRLDRELARAWPVHQWYWKSGPGGNAPIQGEMTIIRPRLPDALGYFRARGESWSVSIWNEDRGPYDDYGLPTREPDWYWWQPYGTWPDASWMPDDHVRYFAQLAINRWLIGGRSSP